MAEIDTKGTQPGLVATDTPPKIIKIRCRDADCDSMDAVEVLFKNTEENSVEVARSRAYRCTKCHRMTILDVGGGINI